MRLKPLIWLGATLDDFRRLPIGVKSSMGYALFLAQQGGKHRDATPLEGFGGASVVEIVADWRGDTFRSVYTVRFANAVYVLHVFQKKAKRGRETPKHDIALVKQRLQEAERLAEGKA